MKKLLIMLLLVGLPDRMSAQKSNKATDKPFDSPADGKSYPTTDCKESISADMQAMHVAKQETRVTKGLSLCIGMVRNGGFAAVIE